MVSTTVQAQVLEPSDMEEKTWVRARGKTVESNRARSSILGRDPTAADVAMPFFSSDNLAAESEYRSGI